jgi:hypothetical protein
MAELAMRAVAKAVESAVELRYVRIIVFIFPS